MLGVEEAVFAEFAECLEGAIEGVTHICVDFEARLGECFACGGYAGHVIGEALALLRDLDFEFPDGAVVSGEYLGHAFGGYGRQGCVEWNTLAHRLEGGEPGGFERAGEPGGRLFVAVFEEGCEFAPASGAADERALAVVDSAEGDVHGNINGGQLFEYLLERGKRKPRETETVP